MVSKCSICGLDLVNGKCPAQRDYNPNNKQQHIIAEIDNVIYWTYSPFWRKFFKEEKKPAPQVTSVTSSASFPANKETWQKAIKQEISHYENGYVWESKWYKIRGKKVKKGRWVKNPEKAKIIFEKIKAKHKEVKI